MTFRNVVCWPLGRINFEEHSMNLNKWSVLLTFFLSTFWIREDERILIGSNSSLYSPIFPLGFIFCLIIVTIFFCYRHKYYSLLLAIIAGVISGFLGIGFFGDFGTVVRFDDETGEYLTAGKTQFFRASFQINDITKYYPDYKIKLIDDQGKIELLAAAKSYSSIFESKYNEGEYQLFNEIIERNQVNVTEEQKEQFISGIHDLNKKTGRIKILEYLGYSIDDAVGIYRIYFNIETEYQCPIGSLALDIVNDKNSPDVKISNFRFFSKSVKFKTR